MFSSCWHMHKTDRCTMWKQRGLIFPVQWVHVSETLHILCHFFGCYGHFILQQITRSGIRLCLDCRKFNVFAECLRCIFFFLFYLNAVFKYTLWKLIFFLLSSLCLKSMLSLCLSLSLCLHIFKWSNVWKNNT